jgi:hypothetical protein
MNLAAGFLFSIFYFAAERKARRLMPAITPLLARPLITSALPTGKQHLPAWLNFLTREELCLKFVALHQFSAPFCSCS